MLQELDGKVAVITGGGSGIGAALARAVAARGCGSWWSTWTASGPRRWRGDPGRRRAVARAVDVSDAAAVQALADFAFDTFGAVHLLCNNAGVSPSVASGTSPTTTGGGCSASTCSASPTASAASCPG